MTTRPDTLRYMFTAAFAVVVLIIGAASCSVQDLSEPTKTTGEPLSNPGAGDQILSGGAIWEQTSVVVAPGADSHCPNGRAFFKGDKRVYYADLACIRSGTCPPNAITDITTSLPLGSTSDVVSAPATSSDNQFVRMKDGSIVLVQTGMRLKRGQLFGSLFVWRSGDCGTTWALKGVFDGETVLDGRCGWPWMDSRLAVYRSGGSTFPGRFIFDENGNGTYDPTNGDTNYLFGSSSNAANNIPTSLTSNFKPVLGMWDVNANNTVQNWAFNQSPIFIPEMRAKVGLFDNGIWYLDKNGDHVWDPTMDITGNFGIAGDIPIVGKWNVASGDNRDLIGVYRDAATDGAASTFYLDLNGNYFFDDCGVDACVSFGTKGDKPVPWMVKGAAAMGRAQSVGVYRPLTGVWYGDSNGNHQFDGCNGGDTLDTCFTAFNQGSAASPVIGYWAGQKGTPQIGTFQNGTWTLDANGDGVSNAGDLTYVYGRSGDIPLVEFPSYPSLDPGSPGGFGAAWPGSFDRPEAYADPYNSGWLYVVANCSYNQRREMVVGWSYDYGVHWKATQAFPTNPRGVVPLMMTSMGGDSLYLFGNEGTSPILVPLRVNVAAKTVTAQEPWYPFASSGTFSSPPTARRSRIRSTSRPSRSANGRWTAPWALPVSTAY